MAAAGLLAFGALAPATHASDQPNVIWTAPNPTGSCYVSFSADGRWLAASSDATIDVREARSGERSWTLTASRTAMSVTLSPDGSMLAAGSYDGGFEVWRLSDGQRVMAKSKGDVTGVRFAPDGTLASWCSEENTVELWRVPDGTLSRVFTGRSWSHFGVSFSPDGSLLAAGKGADENSIQLWRVADGEPVGTLAGHTGQVRCTAFAPGGLTLVSGADDGTVRLWRVADGAEAHSLTGHVEGVWSLAISREGTIASAGHDALRLWRAADGALLRSYAERVTGNVAFSPDGRLLAYGRETVLVVARNPFALPGPEPDSPRPTCAGSLDTSFNARTGVLTEQPLAQETELDHLLLEPNGDVLIYGGFRLVQGQARRGLARLRPNGSLDPGFAPELHGTMVHAVVRQTDGKLIVAGNFTAVGTRLRTHLARLEPDGSLDESFYPESAVAHGEIHSLALQPDGSILAGGEGLTAGERTDLALVRLTAAGSVDASFTWSPSRQTIVTRIALQRDGKVLVAGLDRADGGWWKPFLIRLTDSSSLDPAFVPLALESGRIASIMIETDGRILVGGVLNIPGQRAGLGLLRLEPDGRIDAGFVSEVWLYDAVNCDVRAMAVQEDGCILVGGRFDLLNGKPHTLAARVTPDGSLDESFQASIYKYPETGEGEFVSSMAMQPDGRLLIAGYLTLINGHSVNSIARLHTDCCDCPGVISLIAARYYADEAAGTAEIAVARAGDLGRAVAVEFAIGIYPFQPPGSATPGSEFAAGNATVVFGADESEKVIRVPIMDDQMAEPNECFTVTLHSPAGDATLGLVTEATVVIVDDETASRAGNADRAFDVKIDVEEMGAGVSDLLLLPNGDLLMAGVFTNVNGVERQGLARWRADGSLDLKFAPSVHGRIRAVALLDDGQILIGGDFDVVNGVARAFLARVNPDGLLDDAFGPQLDGPVLAVARQPDGQVVVGGEFRLVNGSPANGLVRLEANGELDASFEVGSGPRFSESRGLVSHLLVELDGKVLVGGVFTHFNAVRRQHFARLNRDGSVDTQFDPEVTRTGSGLYAIALQPDGKILVSGHFSLRGERGLIRFHPDGALDEGFVTEQSYFYVNALAFQPDGCVLIGGSFRVPPGGTRVGLARLRPDGSLEKTFYAGEGAGGDVVSAIACLPNGQIVVGGNFQKFNALPYACLARLNGDSGGVAPFVVREIDGFTVRLLATAPGNVCSYGIEEAPPFGSVQAISEGGVFDAATRRVRFGPFPDSRPRTLSYSIVVLPGECSRPAVVRGLVQADNLEFHVAGETLLGVDQVYPADLGPIDGVVSEVEAESYAASWQHGQPWPAGPQPIPIEYATRAMTFALANEAYGFDPLTFEQHPALRWLSFGAPFPQCVTLPEPFPSGTADRRAPAAFVPGRPFRVTIDMAPAEHVRAYAVEENVPWDWRPQPGDGSVYDRWNNRLKWGPFTDGSPRTLSYELTLPGGAGQDNWIASGTACFDGVSVRIAGCPGAHVTCCLEAVIDLHLGQVRFALTGETGKTYVIEVSNDLETWHDLMPITTASPRTEFRDASAPSSGLRFYRACSAP